MAAHPLYFLTYSGRNYQRDVEYVGRSEAQPITFSDSPIDGSQPVMNGSTPDSWPYPDGGFITQINEGPDLVKFYAIRTPPFARYEVVASTVTDDLQIINPVLNGNSITFSVSTSHQPWFSSIDGATPISLQSAYSGLGAGGHEIKVTDDAGFERRYGFVVDNEAAGGDDPEPGTIPAGAVLLRMRSHVI